MNVKLFKMLMLCMLNYSEFNSKSQQQESLAMGSPLFSIIAEIFLQHIDTKIQNIINSFDPNGTWITYVDDGLFVSNNKNINADNILKQINNVQ